MKVVPLPSLKVMMSLRYKRDQQLVDGVRNDGLA